MEECIFCKKIKDTAPSWKVYEDEHTVAILDDANDVDGHTLVIPKKHVTNILDCDMEAYVQVMCSVKKVSNHYVEDCGYDGVNILSANDVSAGQSVPHFHVHIIPRKQKDGINARPTFPGAKEQKEEMYKRLSKW